MPTNYASQYARSLSQQYPYVLRFGTLYARNQEGDYRWTSAHTVEVPSVHVTGRVDGSRNSFVERVQRHSNSWTSLALRNHRMWSDFIHPRDIVETNEALSIQNITRVMNEEEKFPEKDKYLLSTIFTDWMKERVPVSDTLTSANILTYFDIMMEAMTERNVPLAGRLLYITPPVNTLLKNATAWARNQSINGSAEMAVQRALSYLDSVKVEEVPSDIMWSKFDFTVGAVKASDAKKVQMFLVHPSAVITPENYDFAQLDPPSAGSQGKYEYFEESFEDVFILPGKVDGIEFLVADMSSASATFTTAASTADDAETGDFKLTITAPTGANVLPGSRYFYKEQASTAPAALAYGVNAANTSGWTEFDGKATTVLNATNGHKLTLLVCDASGRVYASGNGSITSKTSG